MRKLQTGTVPAVGQTDSKPVPPEPKREWPRWKKVVAVVSLAGGALGLGACEECQRLYPRCQIPTEVSADPGSRRSFVEAAERDWNNCDENMRTVTLFNLSDIADDEKTEPSLRTRIIDIFMNALKSKVQFGIVDTNFEDFTVQYALQKLVKFATEGNDPLLRWFVAEKLKSAASSDVDGVRTIAAMGLAAIVTDPKTEQSLFEGIMEDSCHLLAANRLVALLNDPRAQPTLKRSVRNSLESRYMRPIEDLSLDVSKALHAIMPSAGEVAELHLTREMAGAFDGLGKNLASVNEDVRHDALYAFHLVLQIDVEQPVRRMLVDILEKASVYGTDDVRSEVPDVLGGIAMDEKTEPNLRRRIVNILARAWNHESDMDIRRFKIFGEFANIAVYCEDKDPELGRWIVQILGRASIDRSEEIRRDALRQLRSIYNRTSEYKTIIERIFRRALNDESEDVRSLASNVNGGLEEGRIPLLLQDPIITPVPTPNYYGGGYFETDLYGHPVNAPALLYPSQISPFGNPGR